MTLSGRTLIDLPIGALKVLDDAGRDLTLLVLGQRAAHAADEAEPFPKPHHDAQPQFVGLRPHSGS